VRDHGDDNRCDHQDRRCEGQEDPGIGSAWRQEETRQSHSESTKKKPRRPRRPIGRRGLEGCEDQANYPKRAKPPDERRPFTRSLGVHHEPMLYPRERINRRRSDVRSGRQGPTLGRVQAPTLSTNVGIALNWRRERDSNPRYGFPYSGFQDRRLQPLGHLSARL
jgi:hypothetical protein